MDSKELNTKFCEEAGIKKASCYLLNKDTGEVRFYSNISGLYKKPAGWKNILPVKFEEPTYPDLINNSFNFCRLLNLQWNLFGELQDSYHKTQDESFQYNYVKTKLKALQMCKSFGGGKMLEQYKKALKEENFIYLEDDYAR